MKKTYTRDELVNLLLLSRGYEPLEGGAALEASEQLRTLMGVEIDRWYLRLLDEAPADWLESTDLTGSLLVSQRDDGVATFSMPREVRRLTWLQFEGWSRPARITTHDDPEAHKNLNPMWRNGRECPLAVVTGTEVEVYGVVGKLLMAEGICEPQNMPESYTVDVRALNWLLTEQCNK